MPITEPLVLPVDVAVVPVARLAAGVRARLAGQEGAFALTRPQGRARAKLVDADGAQLLEEFRGPTRVADAIRSFAGRHGLDPKQLLEAAFPLLRDCFNAGFLVPAGSPDAAPILASRERGDRVGPYEVLRCVQLRDDTELYQARGKDRRLVAVKLARPGAAELGPMFAREAAVLEHLRGARAPRLLARGRQRGRPWLAMTWSAGIGPRVAFDELREQRDAAARITLLGRAVAIARAYAALHRRGILHGDVHPDNLLIGRRGEVTLIDFGLAVGLAPLRLAGRAPRGGVASYLPPEHARAVLAGRTPPAPTAASEQYALAAVLYALFTGRAYTEFALDREAMLRQIGDDRPLPFARHGIAPWPDVEHTLTRALSKDPAARFPSVRALATALARAKASEPSAHPVRPEDAAAAGLVGEFLARVHYTAPAFREWPGSTAGPTASVMYGAAGVAYALYRLACLQDSADTLALADAWITKAEQLSNTPEAFTGPGSELTAENLGPVSPFHARSGVHLVRTLIALALGDRRPAERAADRWVESSGVPWRGLDLTLGRGGVLLGSALLVEALAAGSAKTAAVCALGNATLASLWQELDRFGALGAGCELDDPAVAHGWAGLLYASLRWCRATGAPRPAGIAARLEQLAESAEPLGRGVHWTRPRRPGETRTWAPELISGWCNGPAGFIHLWTLAHDEFRRPHYLALAEASAWSAWDGRTTLPDLCCGQAGRGYGLLNLYKYSGDTAWLQRARQLSERAAATARRATPQRPLSLFKGVPGIVLLSADLVRPEGACMPCFEPEGWPQPKPAARD